MVKGESQKLTIDFSPLNARAIGENAGDFNFYAYSLDSLLKYSSKPDFQKNSQNRNIASTLPYWKKYAAYKINLLNKYRSKHEMSATYYNWLYAIYLYEPYEKIMMANMANRDSLDDAALSKITEKGINDEYAALNTSGYNDLVDFYVAVKLNRITPGLTLSQRFNYAADSNLLSGATRDVYLSRFMAFLIKEPDSIYYPLFKKYDQIVYNQKLKQLVISRRSDYESPIATPAIKTDSNRYSSINGIFKKYKGKVIYVDFWGKLVYPVQARDAECQDLKKQAERKERRVSLPGL